MKTFKLLMTAAAATLILGSCSKSDPGNGSIPGSTSSAMQFQLRATNPLVVINAPTAGTIQWTSGSAASTEVKLEAKKNGSEIEYKSSTLAQIDLFASVVASLGNITIPAGTYTEVEFKITLNQNGPNAAMELKGQYTNAGAVVTPVVFSLNSLFLLKGEQNNVTVTSGSITTLTTLDLSFVSSGITQAMLNSATITGGKILISSSSNISMYNIIVNNLLQFHHTDVTHH